MSARLVEAKAAEESERAERSRLHAAVSVTEARVHQLGDQLRDVAGDVGAVHERLSPAVTEDLVTKVVATVPDEWLEPEPGLDDANAVRDAYVEHVLARVAAPAAWLPGGAR